MTARDYTDLLAQFTTGVGTNTAQNVKDIVDTALGGYACMHHENIITGTALGPLSTSFAPVDIFDAAHASRGLTIDLANNKIVVDVAGDYRIDFSVTYDGPTGADVIGQIFAGPTGALTGRHVTTRRVQGSTGDIDGVSEDGIITLNAGDEIQLHARAVTGTPTMTLYTVAMTVKRVG